MCTVRCSDRQLPKSVRHNRNKDRKSFGHTTVIATVIEAGTTVITTVISGPLPSERTVTDGARRYGTGGAAVRHGPGGGTAGGAAVRAVRAGGGVRGGPGRGPAGGPAPVPRGPAAKIIYLSLCFDETRQHCIYTVGRKCWIQTPSDVNVRRSANGIGYRASNYAD